MFSAGAERPKALLAEKWTSPPSSPLFEHPVQRAAVQSEGPGRCRLVPPKALDHFLEDVPLDLAELSGQGHRDRRRRSALGLAQEPHDRLLADLFAVGEHHGVGNHVGQLGKVAGPIVAQEASPRLGREMGPGLLRGDAPLGQGLRQA